MIVRFSKPGMPQTALPLSQLLRATFKPWPVSGLFARHWRGQPLTRPKPLRCRPSTLCETGPAFFGRCRGENVQNDVGDTRPGLKITCELSVLLVGDS